MISWLDARSQNGRWHLRIDDIDLPRAVPGASDAILRALDCFGLAWDGPVVRQSQRDSAYEEAARGLESEGHAFICGCSRKDVVVEGQPGWEGPIYPGTCRNGVPAGRKARALRLRAARRHWTLVDRCLGPLGFDLHWLGGDFVIRRADGFFAYQLATVVDDIDLGVTDVVRGIDLLGSAPRQMQLYQSLGRTPPRYLHHPVVIANNRRKLAKSSGATPVQCRDAGACMARILTAIGVPGIEAGFAAGGTRAIDELLQHARSHWHTGLLPIEPIPEAHSGSMQREIREKCTALPPAQ